jgi:hypothetical protein
VRKETKGRRENAVHKGRQEMLVRKVRRGYREIQGQGEMRGKIEVSSINIMVVVDVSVAATSGICVQAGRGEIHALAVAQGIG